MTITRNGIAYELTWIEMREAYDTMHRGYIKEDIEHKAEELEIDLASEDVDTIADIALAGLDHNDSYWECYWATIECAIENKDTEMIL